MGDEGAAAVSTARGIALVTGASSGFGLLTSITLAQKGYQVIATMRDLSRSDSLLLLAEKAGVSSSIDTLILDVTIQTSIEQAVSAIMKKYGRIDVLINNAGFAVGGYVEDVPMEAWRSQLETNVFGVRTRSTGSRRRNRAAGAQASSSNREFRTQKTKE